MKYPVIFCMLLLCVAGCAKRNFFPDEDDPGLSRFTSRGYNITTNYINGVPYVNPFLGSLTGNSLPLLQKISTSGALDTLSLSWQIVPNDTSMIYNSKYQSISLLMPVPKSFSQNDFLLLNGQRFSSNTNSIKIQSYYNYAFDTLSGPGNIYFAQIKADSGANSSKVYFISGLFDGNIGDSILITKGRFDFEIEAARLNF